MRRFFMLAFLLSLSLPAHSEQVREYYFGNVSTGGFPFATLVSCRNMAAFSPEELAAACLAKFPTSIESGGGIYHDPVFTYNREEFSRQYNLTWQFTAKGSTRTENGGSISMDYRWVDPPEPDPVEPSCVYTGLSIRSAWFSEPVDHDARTCAQLMDGSWCEFRSTFSTEALGRWVAAQELTGNTCSGPAGPQPIEVADPPSSNDLGPCIVGASTTVCIDQSQVGKNCGTYNGEPYCADSPPAGECAFIPGGSFICNGSIAVEDQPVNPTTQQPAAQDHWQQTSTENNTHVTNNYFGGSGVAPNKNPPGSGNTGSAPGGGSGGGECEPGQVCADESAYPSLGEVPGFAEAAGKFFNDIQREGLLAEVKRIGQNMPGGACPAPSVAVFGEVYNIDWHCQIYPEVTDVLRWVMLAAWSLLAVLILMSA